MPFSVHYRHGTNNRGLKSLVQSRCQHFLEYYPEVSDLRVVFDKQRISKNASMRGVCHISLRAPGKAVFDTCEEQVNTRFAFERALESTINFLSKSYLFKQTNRKLEPIHESN